MHAFSSGSAYFSYKCECWINIELFNPARSFSAGYLAGLAVNAIGSTRMHASLKSFKFWLPTGKAARWLSTVLCLCSAVSSVIIYLSSTCMPSTLKLLDLSALASVWWLHRDSRNAIKFQPNELAARLLQVQERERQHLSRELHDDVGQLLTAATLQIRWLQGRVPDDLQGHCMGLYNLLEETLTKVRDVSSAFNPRQIATLGIEVSLRAHLIKTLEKLPMNWTFECQQRLSDVPEEMAFTVFRVTQESVTNVLRHAQAKNLHVCLRRQPEGLILSVCDDGAGFVPAKDPAQSGQRGMAGMLERVQQLGGQLSVISKPGTGTQIQAILTWPQRNHARASMVKTP